MPLKLCIFDRDGTLNLPQHTQSHGYVLSPEEVMLLPGVEEMLTAVRATGLTPVVFTQQGGIARGLITEEILAATHARLNTLLGEAAAITRFYHCPHGPDDGCTCRKPKPGMVQKAMADFGCAPHNTLVIGDAARDGDAAANAGCSFLHVPSGAFTPAPQGNGACEGDVPAPVWAWLEALKANPTASATPHTMEAAPQPEDTPTGGDSHA